MTVFGLAAVAVVALGLLLALVLVLRHLKTLHLIKPQVDELRSWTMERLDSRREELERLSKDLEDLKAKHVALSNRVR